MSSSGDIVIVGAGLVGSLLAYILTKKGFSVSVFERYGDIRQIPSLGRSINLVITNRGLRACDAIGGGLREEILSLAVPVTGRVLHQTDGSVQFQRYGKDDSERNYSISRYELNKFLIQKAEESGAKMYFGHALSIDGSDFGPGDANGGGGDVGAVLAFEVSPEGGGEKEMRFFRCSCPVLGCDGAGSRVRYAMKKQGLTDFTESLLGKESGHTHGYKEMLFPKDSGLIPHGLHIWPRTTHMLMALANLDGSMTGTLYMDTDGGSDSFEAIKTPESAKAFFEEHYAEAIPMIGGVERAIQQMLENPSGILGTVRTTNWNTRGRVVLLGDAAHAIVPFFGQGMNCGFEDVHEIVKIIARNACTGGVVGEVQNSLEAALAGAADAVMDATAASKWATAFDEYTEARHTNGNAIADMALENFEEMRNRVGDRTFLLQKRVENRIENCLGEKFRSRYAMVCYGGAGNVTYRNAFKLGEVQNQILKELIVDQAAELEAISDDTWGEQIQRLADSVSMEEAERLIDERVVPMQRELGIDLSTVLHH